MDFTKNTTNVQNSYTPERNVEIRLSAWQMNSGSTVLLPSQP